MYELFPQLTSINFHSFRIATLEMFKPLPKLFQQVAKGAADEVLVSLASKKTRQPSRRVTWTIPLS